MGRPQQSPFMPRRMLSEGPVHLVEPRADAVLLPALAALAALARSGGDLAEVRAILDAVPQALHVVLVDRCAGRQHLAPALAAILRIIPRERLKAMSGARLSRLYQLHRPPAQPVR